LNLGRFCLSRKGLKHFMGMQMEWSYVGAVVISGLAIVFVALILLIIAVSVMGKIFTAIKSGKSGGDGKPKETASVPQPKKEAAAPVSAGSEDESEIIAVISAAVAAMSAECGKPLRIHSIKRSGSSSRSNAWARAARSENTGAF
jgi:sodium pump decarboxylase gamma subunit